MKLLILTLIVKNTILIDITTFDYIKKFLIIFTTLMQVYN